MESTRSIREIRLEDSVRRAVVEVLRKQNRIVRRGRCDHAKSGPAAGRRGRRGHRAAGWIVWRPRVQHLQGAHGHSRGARIDRARRERRPGFLARDRGPRSRGSGSLFLSEARRLRAFRSRDFRAQPTGASATFTWARRFAGLSTQLAALLEGSWAEEVGKWITECYAPEESFGSSFGKLMTRIFAGRGLIFLDPMSPELHRLSLPTMLRAVKEHKALAARTCGAIRSPRKSRLPRAGKSHRSKARLSFASSMGSGLPFGRVQRRIWPPGTKRNRSTKR